MSEGFSHLDRLGRAVMVDIGAKEVSERRAVARGFVRMRLETLRLIESGEVEKGDVFAAARIAGIMAAKRVSSLIPLCHPLAISHVVVRFVAGGDGCSVEIMAEVKTVGRTGVEMEALAAVSVAALTVYDMCKSVDRGMEITGISPYA